LIGCDEMLQMVKKYFVIILIIMLLPLIINLLCLIPTKFTINNNDWIGFWGSYLGSIIGGIITLFVLFQTNKLTKDIQEHNISFDFKKEIFMKSYEKICEIKQTIDNCYNIESIDISSLNYLLNTIDLNIINEELVTDYNNALSITIHELKYFVINQYFRGTNDEVNNGIEINCDNEDNRYMDFQFSDEENKVAIEVSRYILGAKDLEVYANFEPIRNFIRRRAYGRCSDGMELWIIGQLIGFISNDEIQGQPRIENCMEIKEYYKTYLEAKELLLKDINRVIKENKLILMEFKTF
jgi:hypothetical protein